MMDTAFKNYKETAKPKKIGARDWGGGVKYNRPTKEGLERKI